jgi:5'(3')-deoxyribonucleotidase
MRVEELHEENIKKVVFTFGRLNPPHFGHHALIQTLQKEAQKQGADWFLFVSAKTGDEKNPLTYEQKIWWIQALFPETKGHIVNDASIKTPLIAATWLYKQGYRAATFVAGEDDMSSYGEMIKGGNAHGQNNPDAVKQGKGFIFNPLDFAISPRLASATNARRNVTDGDPEAFVRSILGPKINPRLEKLVHDQLYPTLRKAMGLSESVDESAELNKTTPSVRDLAKKYATDPSTIHHQVNRGVKVEFEHTNDIEVATEIAMDHLGERLDYYDLLDKLEKTPKKKFGENFADGKGPGRPGDSQRHSIPKTVDEAMWPFKKKKAPEMSAPKRWPDRDDDLEQWMRDKITHYKSKGWDPAVFFSPATGDYFPIYFATGFRYNDAAKQAYRNIKREFPDLVKRAREEISTPMAMRINQSRVGDHEDWPENSPSVYENFADGKGPGHPGDSQRHGIPKKATIAQLEKASHAKGRKGQLARWQLNMRRGKKKANEEITNEVADQPYRFISPVSTSTTQKSIFQTDGGARMQVAIMIPQNSDTAHIGFYDATDQDNPTIAVTGKGDAFRVFATVGAIVKQFVDKRKPPYINFAGKSSESGRIKLYDMIAKNIGRYLPDYKLVDTGMVSGGDKGYVFQRVAQESVVEEKKPKKPKTIIDGALKTLIAKGRSEDEAIADLKKEIDSKFYDLDEWSPMEIAIMEGGHLLDDYDENLEETLKKVKGKWALVSRQNPKKVLQYYHGSQHPSKEWVNKVERRVHSFESVMEDDSVKPRVYLDMDGVLADFFGEWSRLAGVDHYKDINNAEESLQLVRDHPTFWVDLPMLPHAKALVKTVIEKYGEYRICSKPLEGDDRSKPGKMAWIKKHLSDMPPVEVVLTADKAKYAMHEGVPSILVDDFGVNINAWKTSGGIGIKYDDSAFPQVEKILEKIAKSGVLK